MQSNQNLAKLLTVQDLQAALQRIAGDLTNLAQNFVRTIDAKPEFMRECSNAGVDAHFLWRLERMGRGQLHRELLFNAKPAADRLITLPLSEQTRALTDGVDVLDWDEQTIRRIPVNDLDQKQCKQVFQKGTIRSIAEQRTWLRDKKRKETPVEAEQDYRVTREQLVILRACKIPKRLLLQILMEME